MATIIKFLVALLVSILCTSCNFDFNITGTKGNGNVVTQQRLSNVAFTKIKASEGLDVYLTKSTATAINVQADENLHDLISTEVKNGVLHIHTLEPIGKANAKKVLVNFTELTEINSSSGADIYTTNFIISDQITVNASSGSDQELTIKANHIKCNASSGADIDLKGKVTSINANASSGAAINALQLVTEQCSSTASSGADVNLNCTKTITAKASSAANISYRGNPSNINKSDSSGAHISKH